MPALERLDLNQLLEPVRNIFRPLHTHPVASALAKYNLAPFDPQSVERYKAAMLEKAIEHQKATGEFVPCYPICYLANGKCVDLFSPSPASDISRIADRLGVTEPGVRILEFWTTTGYPMYYYAEWKRYTLRNVADMAVLTHSSGLPMEIARKVAAVIDELGIGNVTLECEELRSESCFYDPFLKLTHNLSGESYYIAQWGNPDFEV